MECFIWSVEPAAVQPLLTCMYEKWKYTEWIAVNENNMSYWTGTPTEETS